MALLSRVKGVMFMYNAILKIFDKFRFAITNQRHILSCLDYVKIELATLEVSGWAISNHGIERIEVFCDGYFIGNATYGLFRDDIGQLYSLVKQSGRAGFHLQCELPLECFQSGNTSYHRILVRSISMAGQTSTRIQMCHLQKKNRK
jgi:hypothetical protein